MIKAIASLLFSLISILAPSLASAYPEFIGYKYSSCITCHFNGQGNGPLNDYGRALWATEIAGRGLAFGRTTEELGMASGFLGSVEMPWWIRPGMKARQIFIRFNPGGNSQEKQILMQAEVNAAVFLDRDQQLAVVASLGFDPQPNPLKGQYQVKGMEDLISREHYVRYQATENLWLYLGMLDIVFGTRIADHTAYNRAQIGLGQKDQTHGLVAQYIQPTWELTGHAFAGNFYQEENLRQAGGSTLFEYEVAEAWRVGASALYSQSPLMGNRRYALHTRKGFGAGHSLLFEAGLVENSPKVGNATTGYYMFSQLMQKIVRGSHLFFQVQSYRDNITADRPTAMRFGTGLLIFPMQRFEFRVELENIRQFDDGGNVPRDFWALLSQIHLSL